MNAGGVAAVREGCGRLVDNVERAVQGKRAVIEQAVCCLLAGGHLLIEDVPGLAKTSLARAIAASMDLACTRIQFTPDLLPADITGTVVFDPASATFSFRRGPVFAQVVIADEINRASPKTQSALLEVMQERTVTVDGTSYAMAQPFFVVATQNPVDLEGTYQLPEAQLDRFAMRLRVGYPTPDVEAQVLRSEIDSATVDALRPVLTAGDVDRMARQVKEHVEVSPLVEQYVVRLCNATRAMAEIRLGVSPRGGLALVRVARVAAAVAGRRYVSADDVKAVADPVLSHRILLRPEAEIAGRTPGQLLQQALDAVPVPRALRS